MRALVQRVASASVSVAGERVAAIGPGLLVLLGVRVGDGDEEADRVVRKLLALRIFEDEDGRTNRSLLDVGGACLVVSQFTLYADTRRGRRPGFTDAASPDVAKALWLRVADGIRGQGVEVGLGVFGAQMAVELVNDGPFTIWLDTRDRAA
jgi:D-tyrosyl-tRNA(Tyr) deacylase